jgi:hypothetical protein
MGIFYPYRNRKKRFGNYFYHGFVIGSLIGIIGAVLFILKN